MWFSLLFTIAGTRFFGYHLMFSFGVGSTRVVGNIGRVYMFLGVIFIAYFARFTFNVTSDLLWVGCIAMDETRFFRGHTIVVFGNRLKRGTSVCVTQRHGGTIYITIGLCS